MGFRSPLSFCLTMEYVDMLTQRSTRTQRVPNQPPRAAAGAANQPHTRLALKQAREDYELESFIASLGISEAGG